MAESILQLKVDSTEYDSKIKRAAQGLQAYAEGCRKVGGTLSVVENETLDFVKALGRMDTVSKDTRGSINEMTKAFTDMKLVYKGMTDEEKASPFGKALSASLDQLKNRIIESKDSLKEIEQELNNVSTAAEKIKGSGGLFGEGGITGMLQVAGGNLIAQGITKLGSEMADTIRQGVELAKQGEGVRLAFERLNKPGLLDNLKEATHGTVSELELMKAAVQFNDFKLPVEQLGTMLEFAQKKAKDTGQSVDYMVQSIVTGLGRKSLMILDNLGLSAAQVKEKMAETGDMTSAVAAIIKEQMSEAGEYVETAADRAARAAADATNEMERLGREAQPFAEEWAKAWNEIKIGGMSLLTTVFGPLAESARQIRQLLNGDGFSFKPGIPNLANGPITPSKNVGKDHTVYAPGGYVEVTDSNTGQVIGGQHFDNLNDANSIKDWQKTLFKTPKTPKTTKSNLPTIAEFEKMLGKSLNANIKPEDMMGPSDAWTAYTGDIRTGLEGIDGELTNLTKFTKNFDPYLEFLKEAAKRTKQVAKANELAAQSASNLGSALASLDDPSAKAAGTVIQAIANIALSFSQAAIQARELGSYGWIAYMAAGTAALATTISTIHSLTGFSEGGEVKGNTYSSDQIPIMANAGEVVLTRAMAGNLASQLQGVGNGQIQATGILQGENILISLERTLKRKGYGELATWK